MKDERKNVTEKEAIEFLDQCKMAYRKAINEQAGPCLIVQLRVEVRYWEDYLHANWPEERAKRELFGGTSEPMTKEQLTGAMDQVYERMKKIPELAEPMVALDAMSPNVQVTAEIWGALKTLTAVVDELIKKLD